MIHRTSLAVLALLCVSLILTAGCAHRAKVVTTTETIECTAPPAEGGERECRTVSKETRTEKPDREWKGCGGIISCGFGAVGAVVSLPFRILGVVLDVVF